MDDVSPKNDASSKGDVLPDNEPALRAIAMPADTNPHGDIFGGWLLCQMDLAGTTVATRRANGRVVTVAITGDDFSSPGHGRRRGDVLLQRSKRSATRRSR